jgi:hypothetical protein
MLHEQRHAPYQSSSAKADDPVITIGSVMCFTLSEYWVPRLRGA